MAAGERARRARHAGLRDRQAVRARRRRRRGAEAADRRRPQELARRRSAESPSRRTRSAPGFIRRLEPFEADRRLRFGIDGERAAALDEARDGIEQLGHVLRDQHAGGLVAAYLAARSWRVSRQAGLPVTVANAFRLRSSRLLSTRVSRHSQPKPACDSSSARKSPSSMTRQNGGIGVDDPPGEGRSRPGRARRARSGRATSSPLARSSVPQQSRSSFTSLRPIACRARRICRPSRPRNGGASTKPSTRMRERLSLSLSRSVCETDAAQRDAVARQHLAAEAGGVDAFGMDAAERRAGPPFVRRKGGDHAREIDAGRA